MKTTEAILSVWYVCPKCSAENTEPLSDNPYLKTGIHCSFCKEKFTLESLAETYSKDSELLRDKLFIGADVFVCECGKKNVILPRVIKFDDLEIDEKHIEAIETSQYGLCEECFAEYKLEYPMPESMEKWLRMRGFKPKDYGLN